MPEIPVWQASEEQLSNPQYLELAKQQMRELIEQYGNHPSVFAWSVLNESAAGSPGGIQFFRDMRDYIKSLDPGTPRHAGRRQSAEAEARRRNPRPTTPTSS